MAAVSGYEAVARASLLSDMGQPHVGLSDQSGPTIFLISDPLFLSGLRSNFVNLSSLLTGLSICLQTSVGSRRTAMNHLHEKMFSHELGFCRSPRPRFTHSEPNRPMSSIVWEVREAGGASLACQKQQLPSELACFLFHSCCTSECTFSNSLPYLHIPSCLFQLTLISTI